MMKENDTQIEALFPENSYKNAQLLKRLLNYIIDSAIISFFFYAILIIMGYWADYVYEPEHTLEKIIYEISFFLLIFIVIFSYYIIFEYFFGFTIGKIVTRTKVITLTGGKPSLSRILGITLCRFIPFEQFSFLNYYAVGWHDRITKTQVVIYTGKREVLMPIVTIIILFIYVIANLLYILLPSIDEPFTQEAPSYGYQIESGIAIESSYTLSMFGLEFFCPKGWEYEIYQVRNNYEYNAIIRKSDNGSEQLVSLNFASPAVNIDEFIIRPIDIKRNSNATFTYSWFTDDEIIDFYGHKAKTTYYYSEDYDTYGQIIVFNISGKTLHYTKEANTPEHLETEFKKIEQIFKH